MSQTELMYPDRDSFEDVIERVAQFKLEGAHVGLVDGSFDVPHPNHEWYLRHCRMLLAQQLLLSKGVAISNSGLREAVESGAVRLIVTVDADMKVQRLKGGNLAKGGSDRPIYPWSARADRLAGYMFRGQSGEYCPVVDLVTVEGDDQHIGTPLETSLTLVEYLAQNGLVDSLVMYGEHQEAIDRAKAMSITPIIIPETVVYEHNSLTGRDWKSSDIIRRVKGEPPQARLATRSSDVS